MPQTDAMAKDAVAKDAMAKDAKSPLLRLPVEILTLVTKNLNVKDLGSTRLTCRAIESSLFHGFAVRFFSKRRFMMATDSLEAFIGMAGSPRLRSFLKHVVIGLEYYAPRSGAAKPLIQHKLIPRVADQMRLMDTGGARDLLEEAFRLLPNLETVDLLSEYSHGGGNVSYGAATARDETGGILPLDYHTHDGALREASVIDWFTRVYGVVVAALGRAQARPKTLNIDTGLEGIYTHGLCPPKVLEPCVLPLLANLENVSLGVTTSPTHIGPIAHDSASNSYIIWLVNFLLHLKNVRVLKLTLGQDYNSQWFMEWLAETRGIKTPWILPQHPFEKLQELDFREMEADPDLLAKAICRFAGQLKRLTLDSVILKPLRHLQPRRPDPSVNQWSVFFSKLKENPHLELDHIKLGTLNQQWDDKDSRMVFFRKPGQDLWAIPSFWSAETSNREYSGKFWRKFLDDIEGTMGVEGLQTEKEYEFADEDEDVDDDDDDGMDDDDDNGINVDDDDDDDDDDDYDDDDDDDDDGMYGGMPDVTGK